MKLLISTIIFSLFIFSCSTSKTTTQQKGHYSIELVEIDNLVNKLADDINRIEIFYPNQFRRLEMDWSENISFYKKAYQNAKNLDDKIHILARFYNSWHNAHHPPLKVKGYSKKQTYEHIALPIKIFGEGLKLSEAAFYISDISISHKDKNINIGDKILSYNSIPINKFVIQKRDEHRDESPEAIITDMAKWMTSYGSYAFSESTCWKLGDTVKLDLLDKNTHNRKKITLKWNKYKKLSFKTPNKHPIFSKDNKTWSFKILKGKYSHKYIRHDNGYYGVLKNSNLKYLVFKMFGFWGDESFINDFIKEAHKNIYHGVILDIQENHGGNDNAFTLLSGLLGNSFHLELSSMRLVPELYDSKKLKNAAVYRENTKYFSKLLSNKENLNKMSPFIPFKCVDKNCKDITEFKHHAEKFPKASVVKKQPLNNLALITGRGTVSKSDSISVLFNAHDIGPIIGTPAMASSGRYYFKKEYATKVNNNILIFEVYFTPDFSLDGKCKPIQGNPRTPHYLIKRTFSNYKYYETDAWIKAGKSIMSWSKKPNLNRKCNQGDAQRVLKEYRLKQIN